MYNKLNWLYKPSNIGGFLFLNNYIYVMIKKFSLFEGKKDKFPDIKKVEIDGFIESIKYDKDKNCYGSNECT